MNDDTTMNPGAATPADDQGTPEMPNEGGNEDQDTQPTGEGAA